MRAFVPLSRAMSGFLLGSFALLVPFVLLIAAGVRRARVSHGSPGMADVRVALLIAAVMTMGFCVGVARHGVAGVAHLPFRHTALAGLAATGLLMSGLMLVGQAVGSDGGCLAAALTGLGVSLSVRGAARIA